MSDTFDHMEKVSITISEYEAHFYALFRYATTSNSTEFDRIQKFIKGQTGYYQLEKAQLVDLGGSFQSIIEDANFIELIHQGTQGDGAKKIHGQGELSIYASRGRDFSNREFL